MRQRNRKGVRNPPSRSRVIPPPLEAALAQKALCGRMGVMLARGDGLMERLRQWWALPPGVAIHLRLRLPFLWLVALAIAALLLPHRVWTTLLVGIACLILVAAYWARELGKGLNGRRKLRFGWVSVGDRLEEQFSITNGSELPALWIEVHDESDIPGYQASVVRAVGGASEVHWRQSAVCTRRGQYTLGPWQLRTGDPFGLFMTTVHLTSGEEIIIHPPIHAALPVPLPSGQSEGRSRARERALRSDQNAATVRAYVDHDPLHWIHWPTSARRDELYVRQFDRDASGDIWLLTDLDASVQLKQEDLSTEESAVLLAAALAARALADGRDVGLAGYAQRPQVIPPAGGKAQQWRLLRALALLTADGNVDLNRALEDLAASARRGSAVLVITPSSSPDWLPQLFALARRGIESQVLLLDRASYGGQSESAALSRSINLLGVPSYVLTPDSIGRPLAETTQRGFWEFRVSGTGRAVAVRAPGARQTIP